MIYKGELLRDACYKYVWKNCERKQSSDTGPCADEKSQRKI
jgi:hypothetical protein